MRAAYVLYFKRKNKRVASNRVLIIKPDAIGDYIICRNILKEFIESKFGAAHDIHLLTSANVIPVIDELDKNLFASLMPLPYKSHSPRERIRFLYRLNKMNFNYILHPLYTSNKRTYEIVKFLNSPFKIGIRGIDTFIFKKELLHFESFFTQLISAGQYLHEFDIQKKFFQTVAEQSFLSKAPYIEFPQYTCDNSVIVCPGSQHKNKIWNIANFIKIICDLSNWDDSLKFIVVTGPGEKELGLEIANSVPFFIDHINNAVFSELFRLFKKSTLVICNDSAPAHISVALNIPGVCVSNGNHFERFVPYTQNIPNSLRVIAPGIVMEFNHRGKENPYYFSGRVDINTVEYELVLGEAKEIIAEKGSFRERQN